MSNERQQRLGRLFDQPAVEFLREDAASVVLDELKLFGRQLLFGGGDCVLVGVGRRAIEGRDELDRERTVVADLVQCVDDQGPVERAHAAGHAVVVGDVKVD